MQNEEIKKIINKQTAPKYLFPELIDRHFNQSKTHLNFFKQLHEHYLYTFFYNTPLNCSISTEINGFKGVIKSPIDIREFMNNIEGNFSSFYSNKDGVVYFNLNNQVSNKDAFFDVLKYSPIPFLFIPLGDYNKFSSFIEKNSSAFVFDNGIIMDLDYALSVGVDFIGGDVLSTEQVGLYYIGFIFNKF